MDRNINEKYYVIVTLEDENYIIRSDKVEWFIKKYERENKPKPFYKRNKRKGRR